MESQPNIPLPERPAHLPERLTVGMKVVRGPSWMWSDQDTLDGGSGVGVVVDATPKSDLDVWVTVRWLDEGANYTYRYGRQPRLAQGCFWVDIIPAPGSSGSEVYLCEPLGSVYLRGVPGGDACEGLHLQQVGS